MTGPRFLDHALAYAERGWHVLPCDGKAPIAALVPHGFKDASHDPARISSWWSARPWANIGISLPASGLIVLDVDLGVMQAYGRIRSKLPKTPVAISGRGGFHHYFAQPDGARRNHRVHGIEAKANGLVVAPPSLHPDTGNAYRWHHPPDEYELAEWPFPPPSERPRRSYITSQQLEAGRDHSEGRAPTRRPRARRSDSQSGHTTRHAVLGELPGRRTRRPRPRSRQRRCRPARSRHRCVGRLGSDGGLSHHEHDPGRPRSGLV